MAKYAIAYALAALFFGALDAVWLSWAGPNLYEPTIGEIMADSFDLGAAGAFYLIYLAGMVWFAIRPGLERGRAATAGLNGVLLGALCYATFDLTSQAVFKVWATHISVMDIAWGAFATGTTSALTTAITLKLTQKSA
ncbi:MAG: DUF2177 family protein [Erythrobacter sp.]|uniref:DUF2177 family protein n=1 Tax=Erythrobacter sp. TaxID=1042 RepID=UPI0026379279|nr:DUF2177 family protein [Erythrobacter sp.]MDJ0977502.1 DUF2177 family protein [Erythrobacter sp.]